MPPRRKTLAERHPTGRKHCSGCGRWRLIVDFNVQEWISGTSGKVAHRLQARCKSCNRRQVRVRRGIRVQGKPFEPQVGRTTFDSKKKRRELQEKQQTNIVKHKETHANRNPEVKRVHYKPFVDWLELFLETSDDDLSAICSRAGTSARAVYRHQLTGDNQIDLVIVERIGVVTGNPQLAEELYPQEERV